MEDISFFDLSMGNTNFLNEDINEDIFNAESMEDITLKNEDQLINISVYNCFELKYAAFKITGYCHVTRVDCIRVFTDYGFNKSYLPSDRFKILYNNYKEDVLNLKKVYVGFKLKNYMNKFQAIDAILSRLNDIPNDDLIYKCEDVKIDHYEIKSMRSCVSTNCKKRSTCNYIDEPYPIYCSDHSKFEMVNIEVMRKRFKKMNELDFIYENLHLM